MTQITDYAYSKIRNYISTNFVYLELQDESSTAIKRFTVADGLTITVDNTNKLVKYQLVVTGADATFTGKTVAKSVLYDSVVSTDAIATEIFTAFTFENENDELTIVHTLKIPLVV